MVYIIYLTLLAVVRASTDNPMFTIITWEIKPYLFRRGNKLDGIVPKTLDIINENCFNEHNNYTSFVKYVHHKETWEEFLELLGTNEDDNKTVWGPFFFPDYGNKKKYKLKYSIAVPEDISVIVKREKIMLLNKLSIAISRSVLLLVILGLQIIIVGLLVSFFERIQTCESEFKWLYGIWWSFIAVTTVGYGDITPKTIIGRFIGIIWVFLGMISLSTFTTLIVQTTFEEFQLNGETIAVFKDSYEAAFARDAQFNIINATSYEDVYYKVQTGSAGAAFVNTDVAGWYDKEIQDRDLQVVQTLKGYLYVYMLGPYVPFDKSLTSLVNCFFKTKNGVHKKMMDENIETFAKKPRLLNYADESDQQIKDNKYVIGTMYSVLVITFVALAYRFLILYYKIRVGDK